jgi:hypothetical protein
MPLAILFWIIMLGWMFLRYIGRPAQLPPYYWGGTVIEFILIGLLGWKVFGPAITGS